MDFSDKNLNSNTEIGLKKMRDHMAMHRGTTIMGNIYKIVYRLCQSAPDPFTKCYLHYLVSCAT